MKSILYFNSVRRITVFIIIVIGFTVNRFLGSSYHYFFLGILAQITTSLLVSFLLFLPLLTSHGE